MFIFILHYFSDDYVRWTSNLEIINHKKNNQELISKIENSEKQLQSIKNKMNTIVDYDNSMRDLLKLPKIHDDVRMLGVGGEEEMNVEILEYLLPDGEEVNLQEYFDKLDFLERTANLELLSYLELTSNTNKNVNKLRHFPAIYPVDLNQAKLTSRFGYRRHPISKKYKMHEGDDFSAKRGTPVVATADGVVSSVKTDRSFGKYIEISHGNGYKTLYAHLNKFNVKKGAYVVRGQKIGEVGNTGNSTAPHLHYEVIQYKKRLDPSNFYFNNF